MLRIVNFISFVVCVLKMISRFSSVCSVIGMLYASFILYNEYSGYFGIGIKRKSTFFVWQRKADRMIQYFLFTLLVAYILIKFIHYILILEPMSTKLSMEKKVLLCDVPCTSNIRSLYL